MSPYTRPRHDLCVLAVVPSSRVIVNNFYHHNGQRSEFPNAPNSTSFPATSRSISPYRYQIGHRYRFSSARKASAYHSAQDSGFRSQDAGGELGHNIQRAFLAVSTDLIFNTQILRRKQVRREPQHDSSSSTYSMHMRIYT